MAEKKKGKITRVAGPVVTAEGISPRMYDVAFVGEMKLMGEVIKLVRDKTIIQVYEDTSGIRPGEEVVDSAAPLQVELGPGLLSSVYDGVQRPLPVLRTKQGDFVSRGVTAPGLDRTKKWTFTPSIKKGDSLQGGEIIGTVPEGNIVHKVLAPVKAKGKVKSISGGEFTVEETIAELDSGQKLRLMQEWPVRHARPYVEKLLPDIPLVTGQRVLDMLFPLAKGGTACVPGPFGSGKTVVQHQLAKWADADFIVYVGCGERGNEMTDVLMEFPKLKDPRTGRPLFERTVLVANTSNMPVAAREASVFTGIAMAEYFRDMGYNVAMMADSTSRWAEAIREISGRLEEMPGEEGYPAYLGSRIAGFYERAGNVICLGSGERKGSISLIGAVSPPGGDLSEPVVQATLRVVRVFWGLDDRLAGQRHFPAINWLTSYSLYRREIDRHVSETIGSDWEKNRTEASSILQREAELEEIVRLVGTDALSDTDRLTMQVARMIREDFLHQNAFMETDTYTSLEKQFRMLDAILRYHRKCRAALEAGADVEELIRLGALERIARSKLIPEGRIDEFDAILKEIDEQVGAGAKANVHPEEREGIQEEEEKDEN